MLWQYQRYYLLFLLRCTFAGTISAHDYAEDLNLDHQKPELATSSYVVDKRDCYPHSYHLQNRTFSIMAVSRSTRIGTSVKCNDDIVCPGLTPSILGVLLSFYSMLLALCPLEPHNPHLLDLVTRVESTLGAIGSRQY